MKNRRFIVGLTIFVLLLGLGQVDGETEKDLSKECNCLSLENLGNLHIFGWSPKGDYFAFGYDWEGEADASFHIHSYVLNSEQNTFRWRLEKMVDYDSDKRVREEYNIRNTVGDELKKLRIYNGTQVYRYRPNMMFHPLSKSSAPDKVSIQIKGRPYTLRLNNQYKEDESHPRGRYAKFELLLINEENQQVQVLQSDKTFFRRAYYYELYAAYLSPEEKYIAVIIDQWEYGFEGSSVITFLGVTGKINI